MAGKSSVLRGAFILSAAGIICKILGAAYRIPLVRLIGDEGIGLYQMAYPVYLVFLALSTAGMPLAISRLVAERAAVLDYAGVRRILRLALAALGGFGLLGGAVMASGAHFYAWNIAADPRALPVILALAPAVPLMALMAALRGYFQGAQEMLPSALSQLVEQVVRVGTLLSLAVLLLPSGIQHAAAGAAFGASSGGLAGLVLLIWWYRRRAWPPKGVKPLSAWGYGRIGWRLLRLSTPIAVGALLLPLMQAIDSIVVPTRLQAIGYGVGQATAALGQLGNAWAVIYVPITITAALATSLVPAVTENWVRRQWQATSARINQALHVTVFLCLPAAAGLWLLAGEICSVLYGTASAAGLLQTLAPAVFFLGLQGVCTGALQGIGRTVVPVRNFALGFLLKVGLTGFLCGLPNLGPRGAGLGTLAGAVLAALLSLYEVARRFALSRAFYAACGQGMLAAAVMAISLVWLRSVLKVNAYAGLALMLPAAAAVYLAVLWLAGGLKAADVEFIRGFGLEGKAGRRALAGTTDRKTGGDHGAPAR